jgi:peptide methionine sulfoxide reductase MsrB
MGTCRPEAHGWPSLTTPLEPENVVGNVGRSQGMTSRRVLQP